MTDVLITGSLPMHHMALEIARRTIPPQPRLHAATTLLADPADHPFDIGRHMLANVRRIAEELEQAERPPRALRMNSYTRDAMALAAGEGRVTAPADQARILPNQCDGLEVILDDGLANGCVEIE